MGKARKVSGGEPQMIRIENLWKKFGRFEALRGLSFDVPDRSAFANVRSAIKRPIEPPISLGKDLLK
jgi:hypothetical protein